MSAHIDAGYDKLLSCCRPHQAEWGMVAHVVPLCTESSFFRKRVLCGRLVACSAGVPPRRAKPDASKSTQRGPISPFRSSIPPPMPLSNPHRLIPWRTAITDSARAPRESITRACRFCRELSHFVSPPLRFCLLVGGDSMEDQFDTLAANPD
eukprot:1776978-Pleurochrysis_carterae.AAC.1